jgi:hypothetical protein
VTTQEERARRRLHDHLDASEDVVHAVLAFRIGGARSTYHWAVPGSQEAWVALPQAL